MVFFNRKKNSGVVETESRESRNINLEETLELTLAEVKELRAEMTMLRRELLGDRFPEHSEDDEFTEGQFETLPWYVNVPEGKELNPLHHGHMLVAQQAAARDDAPEEAEYVPEPEQVKVEGWATVDFKPSNKRRWWQFWKSKKSKEANLDFA